VTITTLDPSTALIVIDLQKGIVALPTAHPTADVVARSSRIADAFRARNLPVVLVHVTGLPQVRVDQPPGMKGLPEGFADFVPELNIQDTDHLVAKQSWGAFSNPELDRILQASSVTQVVIVGIATSIGVESTAREAFARGLNVTLVVDAMTDMHQDAHINSLTRIFPRLAETGTTEDLLAYLAA